jgi:hypothetical protein
MTNKEARTEASDELDDLFEEKIGDPREWGIKAIHRKALTFKYADTATDDPRVAKITPQDVVDYYWNYHGTKGFQASYRFLGKKMGGDWRPIDELAHMCLTWFKTVCRQAVEKAAATHGMSLIS